MAKKEPTKKPSAPKRAYKRKASASENNNGIAELLEEAVEVSYMSDKLNELYPELSSEDGVDTILKDFRKEVANHGFTGVSTYMVYFVKYYGTPEDKAALLLSCYWDMKYHSMQEPKITDKQVESIKWTIQDQGQKAMDEFSECCHIYDALVRIKKDIDGRFNTYGYLASKMVIYLNLYEWLGKSEELFNAFSSLVDESKREDFNRLAENYSEYLRTYQGYGELKPVEGERWTDTERGNCLDYANSFVPVLTKGISAIKSCRYAVEKWIKDNKAKKYVPIELREKLWYGYDNFSISELQDKYCLSHLRNMEESGEPITDEDRRIAIFPDADEVGIDEVIVEQTYNRINEYRENYRNG